MPRYPSTPREFKGKVYDLRTGTIKTAMRRKKLTQAMLADILDSSHSYLQAQLLGKHEMGVSTLIRLAWELDLEPWDIITLRKPIKEGNNEVHADK